MKTLLHIIIAQTPNKDRPQQIRRTLPLWQQMSFSSFWTTSYPEPLRALTQFIWNDKLRYAN